MREASSEPTRLILAALVGAGFVAALAVAFVLATTGTSSGRPPVRVPSTTAAIGSPVPEEQQIAQDASHGAGGPSRAGPATFVLRDVTRDPLPADKSLADSIRLGQQIFTQTGQHAPQYVGNALSCTSCHIDGGQKQGALPLVGIAGQFPAYSPRDSRLISLEDRIRSCFIRSEAGSAPGYDSPELLATAAYLAWLSDGQPDGQSPPWRGQNVIVKDLQIPIDQLQPVRGGQLYADKCATCHGADGQGVVGPPLWGPRSFADGAGTGRVYTLAGYIRYAMPQNAPGTLSDEEAQQIAAFIDSQERPAYAHKDQDYTRGGPPVDAVYYPQRYPQNPLKR